MVTMGWDVNGLMEVVRLNKFQEGLARTIKGKVRCIRGFGIKITQITNGRRFYFR